MEFDSFAAMALAVMLGAGVQAAIGFAFGLIAAPVLLVVIGSGAAIQVLVVVHLVQSLMLVPRLWHLADRRILITLMLASVIGFPIGLLVFLSLDLTALTLAVGISLILFALLLAAREAGYLHMADIRPDEVAALGDGYDGCRDRNSDCGARDAWPTGDDPQRLDEDAEGRKSRAVADVLRILLRHDDVAAHDGGRDAPVGLDNGRLSRAVRRRRNADRNPGRRVSQ